jgi:hypothetical protein
MKSWAKLEQLPFNIRIKKGQKGLVLSHKVVQIMQFIPSSHWWIFKHLQRLVHHDFGISSHQSVVPDHHPAATIQHPNCPPQPHFQHKSFRRPCILYACGFECASIRTLVWRNVSASAGKCLGPCCASRVNKSPFHMPEEREAFCSVTIVMMLWSYNGITER